MALRELPGTGLCLAFVKGLAANSSKEQALKHTAASSRLVEIFSGRSKLGAGDGLAMEFVPGKGTTFYITGQPQGAPVGDAEFFAMVLKIWVGTSPADYQLKDALLGVERQGNNRRTHRLNASAGNSARRPLCGPFVARGSISKFSSEWRRRGAWTYA